MPRTRHVYAYNDKTGTCVRFPNTKTRSAFLMAEGDYRPASFEEIRSLAKSYYDYLDGKISAERHCIFGGGESYSAFRAWIDFRRAFAKYRLVYPLEAETFLGMLENYGLSDDTLQLLG